MKNIIVLLLALSSTITFAQTINGSIKDNNNQAISFAQIENLSTKAYAESDLTGQFNIKAAENDSLEITAIGYEAKIITASNNIKIQLQEGSNLLNTIIVSASKKKESRADAPIAISSVNNEQIKDTKAQTIDQIINQTPGVLMVDLGQEQHMMAIRQPISTKGLFLYLEDGIPIRTTGIFNHNALLEINMANTEKIEIIRGPSSSIYGTEAIGGAINFISKQPTQNISAGAELSLHTLGYKRADFYASNTFNEKLGVRVSGYHADMKNNYKDHGDFDKTALSLQANYLLSTKSKLKLSTSFVDYYSEMSGSIDSTQFYDKDYNSPQEFTFREVQSFRTSLSFDTYWNDKAHSTVTAYFRENTIAQNPSYRVKDDYKPWSGSGNPNLAHGEENENHFNSYGLSLQHNHKIDQLNATFTGGLSAEISPADYMAEYISINKDGDKYVSYQLSDSLLADYDVNISNIASYVQGTFKAHKNVNIVAGARFDYFEYDFDNSLDSNAYSGVLDSKSTFSHLSPKLGLTWNVIKDNGIYFNVSQGFLPPQVGELYRGTKVPDLKPSYFNNYEIGGWVNLLKNKLRIELGLYQLDGKDEIISVTKDDGSSVNENAGSTRHIGLEYLVSYQPIKDLSFKFNGTNVNHNFVSYEESGNDLDNNNIAGAPKWIANSTLTYKPSYLKGARVGFEWQHVDNYFMNNTNTKVYDGYDVFNLRLGYEIQNVTLWSNFMNLGDELYATRASSSKWGDSFSTGNPFHVAFGIAYDFNK